jgi:hypothetical protein
VRKLSSGSLEGLPAPLNVRLLNCMVSIQSNACIRSNQMRAFDPVKCMHSIQSNACIRVQENQQDGARSALLGCLRWSSQTYSLVPNEYLPLPLLKTFSTKGGTSA